MRCELCGQDMHEGELGEKAWVCGNKECERSDPMWLSDSEKQISELLTENDEKVKALTTTTVAGMRCEIEFHKVRFMGEGSGTLLFENGERVPFMKSNGAYIFYTIEESMIHALQTNTFLEYIENLRHLSIDRVSEILEPLKKRTTF
ncbi:hypothetical protein JOD82_002261 [Paenibacillus sp. 1182]|uniref:hypothetical protein n=1 Tax=Paenibacillus sp. 1182 TaxID=2806565 RepID=UPI001AE54DF3|nr:hypothetical protein [Paenibacillus sp. 1182]MBP1309241.1 hypothetical protein [Paenibacillus sp. 1182]